MNKTVYIASGITINALRFALALVFAFSGFVKAVDPMGTVIKLADYAEAFSVSIHPACLWVGALTLITIEYVMGIALFFGLYRRLYLGLMIAFLGVMTPFTLVLALTNPVSDCGCFGDAVQLTNWQTFGKNVILLLTAVIVLIYHKRISRIISERTQWLVFVYALVSITLFMQHNLRHLPAIDFRPYHIGTNIIDAMTVPDDAPQDEYETLFVLEKDGKQHTFTFDNYPDSTWTFVRRENRLVSKGYVPPITDFYLSTPEGEDVTWDVLTSPGYTFLIVARNLNRANEGMLDVINDLYDYAKVGKNPFYMITSSTQEDINEWDEHTGATYPYLHADETLLKTMVRTNIGLLVLKDASIIGKWSAADLPRDEQLNSPMKYNAALTITPGEVKRGHITMLLWMFFPLLLLTVSDKIGRRRDKNLNN